MIEVRSQDLPPAERFDWWCELTSRELVPTHITPDDADDFRASAAMLGLGPVQVSLLRFPALRSVRTRQLIRRSDPELWELALISSGSMWLEQNRNDTRLHPGDLTLYDTSQPFEATVIPADTVAHAVVLHLPRRAVPVPEQALRAMVARQAPAGLAAAPLLARYLHGLSEQAASLAGPNAARLGHAAVELATVYLSALADAEDLLPPHTRAAALLHQIKAFIIDHLHEADLSPPDVAAAHHISVRYLHHLFRQDDQGPGEFIRDQRLRRCRADLSDPCLAGLTVASIAARWGFPDPAVFNRAFKKAYGIPPGQFRRQG